MPLAPNIASFPQYIHSFTSLSSIHETTVKEVHIPQDWSPPHNFDNPHKTAHTLPSGPQIGNLLHEILETIPFDIVKDGLRNLHLLNFVDNFTKNSVFVEWHLVVCDIIYHALLAV